MRTGLKADRTAGLPLRIQPAGHALLIHAKGGADPQALAFAAGLAPDSRHTLVVVDLPFGTLEEGWERVARLLAGRPGNLRLVFGRATPAEARAAGQRIADRLERTVLVPDGELLPTAGGGLFIPADHGSGWLRLRPGRAAERDSHRFPKPLWEFSTLDRPWETSPYGVVEAVPSGVWLRSTRPSPPLAGWRRLVDSLPSDPQIMNVVLGSPGGPAVPLADVVRFWGTVLHSVRSWVRFVHYGPVSLPEGSVSLGQELADAFRQRVVLYAGMPTVEGGHGGPARVRGLHADGSPGWLPFAAELVYSPRRGDAQAPPPALVGLRVPLTEVPEIAAGVYQYASDAVLEIVQSGLWLRPTEEPAGADDVRRLQGGPGRPQILYDRSAPQTAERMRTLAEDLLWRLDPESRDAFRIAPADAPGTSTATDDEDAWRLPPTEEEWRVVAAAKAARRRPAHEAPWSHHPSTATRSEAGAAARANGTEHASAQVGSSAADARDRRAGGVEAVTPGGVASAGFAAAGQAPVSAAPAGEPQGSPAQFGPAQFGPAQFGPLQGAAPAAPAQFGLMAGFGPAQAGPQTTAPRPQTESGHGAVGGHVAVPQLPAAASAAATAAPASGFGFGPPVGAAPVAPAGTAPFSPPRPAEPAAPTPAPEPAPVADPEPSPAPTAAAPPIAQGAAVRTQSMAIPRIRMESDAPGSAAEAERDADSTPAVPAPTTPGAAAPGPGTAPTTGAGPGGVRVQPVPRAAACAVPPERGIEQEQAWVRRTFSSQYNAIAGTVSRVMSESPGLRGASRAVAGETLTDLVAVRLYLSGDSAAVDRAIRAATVGSHVPLARCVASGLRRLPSYRGTALLQADINQAERDWYREGRLATEWAFCTAWTDTHPAPAQATDFLLWSMTARRTNLLDPGTPDRVLFLPGTTFKVLRRDDDGDRPTVLLRELSPAETAENGLVAVQRVPLDEIALESLERSMASLKLAGSTVPGKVSEPLGSPPGLIVAPTRTRPAADRGRPIEGAEP